MENSIKEKVKKDSISQKLEAEVQSVHAGDLRNYYDQVNVRLPVELNDWLNNLVRQTKRLHGSKIPKEIIIEGALQHLRSLDLDWTQIKSKDDLILALTPHSTDQ